MNVTIENLAPCRKALRVDVDAKTVDDTFKDVTQTFQREAKLPGFRPGKVPLSVIEKNFTKALEDETRRKLLNESYSRALKDHNIHAVGNPEIETIQFGRGQDFQVKFTVETAPEFELPEYKGLPAKKEKRTVTDGDVEKAIDVLRERVADYKDVERAAQTGDFVVVNYTGTSEGKPLTEFSPTARGLTHQENFWMEIKPGHFVPGFTEQLVGTSKGEKKTITVEFPQDFVAPQLVGKKAEYQVEIIQVKEKALPELNDEFATKWGAENLQSLKEGVRKDLETELQNNQRKAIRTQLVEGLSNRVQCELPQSLIDGETRNVIYDIVLENQRRGISKEKIDEQKDQIFNFASANAKERLKTSFLLGRVAEKEGIKVTQEEIANRVLYMAQQQQTKPEALIKELKKNNGFPQIHENILLAKVVDFLEQHAAVEEVEPAPEPAQPTA